MKTCIKCNITKSISEFYNDKSKKDGHRSDCKICNKTKALKYHWDNQNHINEKKRSMRTDNQEYRTKLHNKDKKRYEENTQYFKDNVKRSYNSRRNKILQQKKEYYALQDKEKLTEYQKTYRKNNKAKLKLVAKKWVENNRAKYNACKAKRRAAKIKRTPKWLTEKDFEEIESFYELAKFCEEESNYTIKFHVDHIIPLQGKTVSGFHCPSNLQVITAKENLEKSNNF